MGIDMTEAKPPEIVTQDEDHTSSQTTASASYTQNQIIDIYENHFGRAADPKHTLDQKINAARKIITNDTSQSKAYSIDALRVLCSYAFTNREICIDLEPAFKLANFLIEYDISSNELYKKTAVGAISQAVFGQSHDTQFSLDEKLNIANWVLQNRHGSPPSVFKRCVTHLFKIAKSQSDQGTLDAQTIIQLAQWLAEHGQKEAQKNWAVSQLQQQESDNQYLAVKHTL